MKNLFLCSYFTGVKDTFKDFMNNDTKGKKALFIPTANIDEETKFLVDEAKEVFKSLGMEVEDLEISKLDEKTIKNKIEKANYLYVGGGNTFYLLQELKRKNLIDFIKNRVNSGMVYIGESAGAIITSKDTEYSDLMDDVSIAKDLKEYSGLNLVDFYIVPHLNEFPFEESSKQIVEKYKDILNIIAINNSQAIIIKDDSKLQL
ncbi:peptidase S51 [Fusobacterium polymorphum]|uniref:Peptidase S51 n=1 Tax=Fusobacterium nucleatum subsp. polymorphum TaxID=76857 RepID=A0A2B7YNA1_FUSNP|nr:Type 1 glutamine amidotransferase-like domain-containing protein [Fusobacterium polymorphum]PGH22107.1 peptidase S51 [Fusobacterium polymorphum]